MAAAPVSGAGKAEGAAIADAPVLRKLVLPFSSMGASSPIRLRAAEGGQTLGFGVRLDEAVSRAHLKLSYTYSPALVFSISHIRVILNEELIDTIPLDKEHAGHPVTREIDIDPRYFTDFNHLRFELIGHYTTSQCEDPMSTSVWAQISPASTLELQFAPLKLPNDLSLFPAPFFDRHDDRKVELPFVLPARPSFALQQIAGEVASWFGAQAAYRQIRIPVLSQPPADQNAVVFVLKGQEPAGVALPELQGPTIAVTDNPRAPYGKLLLIAGRNESELKLAAEALVSAQTTMSGARTRVGAVDLGPPRKPYDSPNLIPTDRPVHFAELVNSPADLEVEGYSGLPIRINLRLPADLSPWLSKGVPMDLKYRFTAPVYQDDSVLNVSINNLLIESMRLRPVTGQQGDSRFRVPLLSSDHTFNALELLLPAFRVGSDDQLQFTFRLLPQNQGACLSGIAYGAKAEIDPDSVLDFSSLPHFAAMPNLSFFANGGYPFSRMADLSDTAIVMPDQPGPAELEAEMSLFGHLGIWTGVPALRATVLPASQINRASDKNLLVLGTGSAADLLQRWQGRIPLTIHNGKIELAPLLNEQGFWRSHAYDPNRIQPAVAGREQLYSGGSLAALEGFESPLQKGQSVVALLAARPEDLGKLLDVLDNPALRGQINGDVAILRADTVRSYHLGETYYIGHLPIWKQAWFHLSRYPLLVAAAGILAGLALALMLFLYLSRLASRRLGG
jgi:hypothetical protein